MNQYINSPYQPEPSGTNSMFSVSDDGYIRLSFANLQTVPLIHLISGLDENSHSNVSAGATPTEIVGYTEWVSNPNPTITIGWDWKMEVVNNYILLRRISEPSSNIMLHDGNQIDIGQAKTVAQLEALIDALNWQIEVRTHINIRYAQ